ncbi:hypothetical protein EDD18DRAFT_1110325 [Armillaria luteobubalina]|uniref:Uncharacterized protein n=1 Tax=Armillaria luteobubalina TaxID=153913 RepID=A0AA39ULU8_9AGAR|nr:hypothetical protein EDD18DRAFT_1110325 [Armillaria luteobubalina]
MPGPDDKVQNPSKRIELHNLHEMNVATGSLVSSTYSLGNRTSSISMTRGWMKGWFDSSKRMQASHAYYQTKSGEQGMTRRSRNQISASNRILRRALSPDKVSMTIDVTVVPDVRGLLLLRFRSINAPFVGKSSKEPDDGLIDAAYYHCGSRLTKVDQIPPVGMTKRPVKIISVAMLLPTDSTRSPVLTMIRESTKVGNKGCRSASWSCRQLVWAQSRKNIVMRNPGARQREEKSNYHETSMCLRPATKGKSGEDAESCQKARHTSSTMHHAVRHQQEAGSAVGRRHSRQPRAKHDLRFQRIHLSRTTRTGQRRGICSQTLSQTGHLCESFSRKREDKAQRMETSFDD